jgi:serine phosphatase RsbU (regulator of sigma subunit)
VPPLLRAENHIMELPASGPALGMFAESTYITNTVSWQPADFLLLYTDGLTDAIKTSENDEDKLQMMWKELIEEPTLTAQEVVDVLLGEARAALAKSASSGKTGTSNNGPHRDDITLLLAKRP